MDGQGWDRKVKIVVWTCESRGNGNGNNGAVYPGDDVPVSRDVAKAASAPPKEEIPFTVNHLFPNIPTNKVPDNS